MKKKVLILLGLILSVTLFNCNKENDSYLPYQNEIIYKRANNNAINNHFCGDNVISVSKLDKRSPKWKKISKVLKSKNLDKNLDLNSLKLSLLDNSDVNVYTIKSKNKKYSLVIYEQNDNYLFQKMISKKNGKLKHLASYDLLGNLLYEMDFNKNNQIGNINIGNGDILYGAIINHPTSYQTKNYSDSCPATTATFGDCMNCAIHECFDDWICAIAMGVEPELIFGTFGAVCGIAQL